MTTDIAKIPGSALSPEPPGINPAHQLSWELNRDVNPDPSSKKYDPILRECARLYLDALEQFSKPVSEERLLAWLNPIPLAVRNEKSPEAMAGWIAAVMFGMADMEAGAFTAQTQRSALRTFQFFPSVADIAEVVILPALAIREKVRVLRIIAREPTDAR